MIKESLKNIALSDQATGKQSTLASLGASTTDDTTTSAKKTVPLQREKPPAVESKPFAEFIQQDYLPALTKGLTDQGVTDLHVNLERSKIAVKGFETAPECSQVIGYWNDGKHQFNIYFFDDDIQGQRAFSCIYLGHTASTIESFLVLERKITLDLLVLGLIVRLNSQRWLPIHQ
jgi:Protein of unknown function (DUF2996)